MSWLICVGTTYAIEYGMDYLIIDDDNEMSHDDQVIGQADSLGRAESMARGVSRDWPSSFIEVWQAQPLQIMGTFQDGHRLD